ncbi:MAG: Rrf2 family transcriptional regulator [Cytophagaceae bacterium]
MFSKSCEYAFRAIFYISLHGKNDKKIGIKEISDSLDLPAPFLAKILQLLVKQNVLSSMKGPNGGFYIKSLKKISLVDIVEAIDGTDVFDKCTIGLKRCSDVKPCPIHHLVKDYRNNFKKILHDKTLAQMITELENKNTQI